MDAGVIRIVLTMMTAHAGDAGVQKCGCVVLIILALNNDNMAAITCSVLSSMLGDWPPYSLLAV